MSFHCTRWQNLKYARDLLTLLERDALAMKNIARRQETQVSLNRQRELLEQVTDRLADLTEVS